MKKLSCLFLLVSMLFFVKTTLQAQAPTISSFTPMSGALGTVVTLTGTNFNTTAANNIGRLPKTCFSLNKNQDILKKSIIKE
jgi:hypothetical protein